MLNIKIEKDRVRVNGIEIQAYEQRIHEEILTHLCEILSIIGIIWIVVYNFFKGITSVELFWPFTFVKDQRGCSCHRLNYWFNFDSQQNTIITTTKRESCYGTNFYCTRGY